MEIRWTHQAPGRVLESAAGLTPPVTWQPTAESPMTSGNLRVMPLGPAVAPLSFPALTSVTGTEAPFPAGITASNNGPVQVPLLTTIVNCPITEQNGGVVERP